MQYHYPKISRILVSFIGGEVRHIIRVSSERLWDWWKMSSEQETMQGYDTYSYRNLYQNHHKFPQTCIIGKRELRWVSVLHRNHMRSYDTARILSLMHNWILKYMVYETHFHRDLFLKIKCGFPVPATQHEHKVERTLIWAIIFLMFSMNSERGTWAPRPLRWGSVASLPPKYSITKEGWTGSSWTQKVHGKYDISGS